MGRQVLFAHRFGQQEHFQLDVKSTGGLITLIKQVRQRLRIALRAGRLGAAERLQRFGGHDPR
ncbi:hypothetical protein D3C76_1747270 [compost metagenome]